MKIKVIFISAVVFFPILTLTISCSHQKAEWKGTIGEENGVTVVKNPKEPMYGEDVFSLEEELSIGEAEGRKEYMFSQVREISVDEDERIYVLDSREAHIKVFDKTGDYLKTIGRKGQGPGEIGVPTFMSITKQNEIIVEDPMSRRLVFYSLEGEFLRNLSNARMTIAQTKCDSRGNILGVVINIEKQFFEIRKFDSDLNYLCSYGSEPFSDEAYNPFKPPSCWAVTTDDNVVFGNPEKYKLQIFNPEGKVIKKIVKDYNPVKITQEEIEEAKKGVPPGDKLNLPDYHCPFIRFTIDDEERIFVQTWEKINNGEGYYYDVFDPEARYIAKIPLRARPRIWKKNKLYTIEEDEDGYQYIKRYKVTWKY